jgi:hypothetical protein
MRDALARALDRTGEDDGDNVDRILAAAFFRKRPLQAGSSAHVVRLSERRVDGPPKAAVARAVEVDPKDRVGA